MYLNLLKYLLIFHLIDASNFITKSVIIKLFLHGYRNPQMFKKYLSIHILFKYEN